jgi:hypothetical protein
MFPINLNMYIKLFTLQKTGVGIKQSVEWLDNRQDEPGSDPAGLKEFSLLQNVQTVPGAHTPSNKMGIYGPFPGYKTAGA